MLSRNNFKEVTKRDAQSVPHYGLRKLSVGVASVLLSTTLYMGVSASADTVTQPNTQSSSTALPAPTSSSNVSSVSSSNVTTSENSNTASANTQSSPTALSAPTSTQVNAPKEVTSATDANVSTAPANSSNVSSGSSSNANTSENSNAVSANTPATTTNPSSVSSAQPAGSLTNGASINEAKPVSVESNTVPLTSNIETAMPNDTSTVNANIKDLIQPNTSLFSPFVSLAVVDNDRGPISEATATWTIHYVQNGNTGKEVLPPTTFSMKYHRSVSSWATKPRPAVDGESPVVSEDGKPPVVYSYTVGQWEYVPGSFTQSGTQVVVQDAENQKIVRNTTTSDGKEADDFSFTFLVPEADGYKRIYGTSTLTNHLTHYKDGQYDQAENMSETQHLEYKVDLPQTDVRTITWTVHHKESGTNKTLKPDTTITIKFTRTVTNPSSSNPTYGDWSYVPGSLQQTGTPMNLSKEPTKQNDVHDSWQGEPGIFDKFTYTAISSSIDGYHFDGNEGVRFTDWFPTDSFVGYTLSGDEDQTIYYALDTQSATVKYVDDDAGGAQVGDLQTLTGATGSKVATNIKAPTNYVLKGSYPSEYTFTTDANQQLIVHLTHAKQSVNDQKTVTRTVNYTDPKTNQTKLVEQQTATLHRTGTKDLVTNNTNWNAWSTDQFKAVSAPSVAGYQVTNGNAAGALTVNDQSKDSTVTFTYTANAQTTHVKYVDKDNPSNVIHTTDLSGKTGQTVNVPSEVPTGWQLVSGQQVPTSITFTDNGYPDTTVKIEHKHTTVTPDHPKTTNDKLPDNPTKSYPSGVGQNDLNKTITRTIQVTDPHTQKVTTTTQPVHLTRTADVDEVSGAVTYGKWTTGEWPAFNTPNVPGYTPTQANVAKTTVTDTTKDQTVTITYTAQAQTTHIKYVDKDNPSNVIHTTNVSGKTNQTVSVPSEVPAGWQLVSGQQVPTSITFTDNGYPDTTVKIEHKHTTVTPDHPKTTNDKLPDNPTKSYPSGVGQNDLNKTITRTIQVVDPHTQEVATTTQPVHLTRTADVDEVSGAVTYGKWTTGEWPVFNTPSVAGYTPTQASVTKTTVTDTTEDQTVKITYNANAQTTHVKYVDKDNPSNVIHTTNVSGKTGQTVSVSSEVPAGWQLVSGQQVPTSITFTDNGYPDTTVKIEHKHTTVTPDHPKTTNDKLPDNPTKSYPSGVGQNDLNKTITRTIQVTDPHTQKVTTTTQPVHLTRTADVDEVSGAVTYGKWTTSEWPVFNTPNVPGYTPSQANVAKMTVTDTTQDQTVKITYAANPQSTTVNYVDPNNQVIHSTPIKGVTDQTVSVPSEVPTGWKLSNGSTVPTNLTFGPTGHPVVTVHIEHQHVTVTPDQPKTPSDKLPDNPTKSYPSGVDQNDLNKTITRTIKVVDPHTQKVTTTTQPVHLTRTADVDEITGAVKYGNWTTGKWNAYVPDPVDGYTPSVKQVDALPVTATMQDETVTITYAANPQEMNILYVDHNHPATVVKTQTITGKTDQIVPVPNAMPAGWKLTPGQEVPERISFSSQGHDNVVVEIEHAHVTVTPDQPKTPSDKLPDNPTKGYPAGVAKDDLNKTITRTIQVVDPHTQQVATTTQPVHLTRTANVDEIDGTVTYGKWTTGEWPTFNAPVVAGYTPSQTNVAKATVTDTTKDQTVKITYVANPQSTTVNYVDRSGKTIHTTPVKGVTDQTVKVPSEVPAGWKLVDGQAVPKEITFGPDGYPAVTVKIEHGHVTVTPDQPKTPSDKLPDNPTKGYPTGVAKDDLNKTITRTIQVVDPHTQKVATTTQPVHLTRTANVDEVDGTVTYGKWTTGTWNEFTTPVVPGYTPSQTNVAKTTVTDTTKDQTVKITYAANPQSTTVNYVDKDGKVVHTTPVKGVTDQTVKVPSEVPAGWKLVTGQTVPSQLTFGPDGHPAVTVKIEHQTITVTPDKPVDNGTKLPDNPNLTYQGVTENDLNKVTTRTINVKAPNGKVTTTKQTVHLTRSATIDEATGQVTYGKWSTGTWDAFTAPQEAGYTPTKAKLDKVTVTDQTRSETLTIEYTANPQSTMVQLVDRRGKVVQTTKVNGHTDETVPLSVKVPNGWKLVAGEKLPTEIHFTADGHPIVQVTVEHGTVKVTPDHPYDDGTPLPDNPDLTFHGVDQAHLNKLVTRTINVKAPNGQVTTEKQTVHLTRSATVDEVTGAVTYDAWTTGEWQAYTVPSVPGYTPSQAKVDPQTVTSQTQDQVVNIDYTANAQSTTVTLVDPRGKEVVTDKIDGHTDETVPVTTKVPAGWQLVPGEELPTEIHFTADGHPAVTVKIEHRHVTVTPDHPYDDGTPVPDNAEVSFHGVSETDLNRTITRTIVVNVPGQAAKTIVQTAHLTRSATVDEVTGAVVYEPWTTAEWPDFDAPAIDGYEPDQTKLPSVKVMVTTKDQTVVINYHQVVKAEPAASTTPASPATPAKQVTPNASKAPQQASLPQTGNDDGNDLAALGLLAAGTTGMVLSKKKRQTR